VQRARTLALVVMENPRDYHTRMEELVNDENHVHRHRPIFFFTCYCNLGTEIIEFCCVYDCVGFPRRMTILKVPMHVVFPVDLLTEFALNRDIRASLVLRYLRSGVNFKVISIKTC
jgi:hypothetical protein